MLTGVAARLEATAAGWSRRRMGADPRSVTLGRRRIYLLPTRYGAVFALLVFAMLLGSINYGTSLGFALTFLLAGLGFVIMHHCHGNLLGIDVKLVGAEPVFAGQTAQLIVTLVNDTARPRFDIELDGRASPVDLAPGEHRQVRIPLAAGQRGWHKVPRFTVESRHPGKLFRAWTWIHMDAAWLVYPLPAPPGRPAPATGGVGGIRPAAGDDDIDFMGLRTSTPSDPPQRLAWKAYARSDELLAKQFAGGSDAPTVFDYDALTDLGIEQRLAQLARWCVDAHADSGSFGLMLRGLAIPPARGDSQLRACLRALAEFNADGSG